MSTRSSGFNVKQGLAEKKPISVAIGCDTVSFNIDSPGPFGCEGLLSQPSDCGLVSTGLKEQCALPKLLRRCAVRVPFRDRFAQEFTMAADVV
jgi:hypothetical protein